MDTKPQIAIVGTEGSGKTILASVWAKQMSSNIDGAFLHPQGWETAEYVEKVWNNLNNGEWWKSTEAGYAFELQWTLHIGQQSFPLKLIDSAGQDLRELFSKDTHKQKNLSGIQRELLEYIQTASIVIIVVNLLHFRGEPDGLKRKQNEFVLKEVVDMFAADNKHQDIAVVFTAWDLYHADITKNYGDFTNYLQKELTQLYNAMYLGHQSGDSIRWFAVAAVMDTEVRNNIRVPKPGFRSGGLDKLSQWLINAVQGEQSRKLEEVHTKEYEISMKNLNQWLIPTVSGLLGGAGGFLLGTIFGNSGIGAGTAVAGAFVGVGIAIIVMWFSTEQHTNKNNKTMETEKEYTSQEMQKTKQETEQTEDTEHRKYREYADTPDIGKDTDTVSVAPPVERKSKSIKFK
jgi:GTPase SAR1 family protein